MRASLSAAAAAAAIATALTALLVAPHRAAAQAATSPAAAQADVRRPDAPAVPSAAALVRTAATFRFTRRDAAGLPAEVTVADSAGQLVARYRLDGECVTHAMAVTLVDTDLVLQAETPSGRLTLRLDGQNASAPGPMAGRWWLGDARGALRGQTR